MIRHAGELVLVSLCIGILHCGTAHGDAELVIQRGHGFFTQPITFSSDSRFVLTTGGDRAVCLWDATTGQELRRFEGHTGQVTSAAFSRPNQLIVTGSQDGTARLWDAVTGRELHRFEGHSEFVTSVAFSPPDDRTILTVSGRAVHLWDVKTGKDKHRLTGHAKWVKSAKFAPDGRTVLTAGDEDVRLWDVETGKELHRFKKSTEYLTSAVFSPDGRTILTVADQGIRLWDVETKAERFHLPSYVRSAVFSPDGKSILIVEHLSVHVLDVTSGQVINRFDVPSHSTEPAFARVESATFYADSTDGLSILMVEHSGSVSRWGVKSGRELRRLQLEEHANTDGAIFAPNGRLVLISSPGATVLYDGDTGEKLCRLESRINAVKAAVLLQDSHTIFTTGWESAYLWDTRTGRQLRHLTGYNKWVPPNGSASADGAILTLGDENARLWDVKTGKDLHRFESLTSRVADAVVSPDGRFILTVGGDNEPIDWTVRLWEVGSKKVHRLNADLGNGRDLAPVSDPAPVAVFSPDSNLVLIGSYETVTLWDVRSKQKRHRLEGHRSWIHSAVFAPNSQSVATAGRDGTARLWNVKTGKELHRLQNDPGVSTSSLWDSSPDPDHDPDLFKSSVTSAIFSPDGQSVLTAGGDGTLRLWDVKTGDKKRFLARHTGVVNSAIFSPNGGLVLTASGDRTACLWDADTGQERQCFKGHGAAVISAVFAFGDRFVLTTSADGTTRLWNTKSEKELARLVSFTDGTWVVATPDGQFDTNNLEEIKGLHWIMPDDPLRALPLEIFMRDYYEPQLLPRLLAGKKLPRIRSLDELNRAQPKVEIVEVNRDRDVEGRPGDTVAVTVRVAGARETFGLEGQQRRMETGAYDLRLFRDGQLVGQQPQAGGQVSTVGLSAADELQQWRQGRRVVEIKDGTRQIVFKGVRLPRRTGITTVQFSAYAFNEDRVKSETARKPFVIPTDLSPRRPRAYLVTVGVNAFEDGDWNLTYAVNDARQLGNVLTKQLKAQRDAHGQPRYEDVVWVGLTAESQIDKEGHRQPTTVQANKAQIEAVLKTLSGQPVNADALQGIAHAEQLRRANPEDLVLLAFSTHGEKDERGGFYLLPHDIGINAKEEQHRRVRAISNDELSTWLQGLDAIDFVMIVDACHSAASVESEDFKPGPMGSRGLGQLAYDKRMRILAASQSQQSANETHETQMGLLSYALVREGLEENKADYKPKDQQIWLSEWLSYAVERVPKLDRDRGRQKGKVLVAPKAAPDKPTSQQPALFDFARQRDVVIGSAQ